MELPRRHFHLLLVLCLAAPALCKVNLVCPDHQDNCEASCSEEMFVECANWTQFASRGENVFSQSDTEWRFGRGNHTLLGGTFNFVNVSNISLTCDRKLGQCYVVCAGAKACVFNFFQVSDLSLSSLIFEYRTDSSDVVFPKVTSRFCVISRQRWRYSYEHLNSIECRANRSWVFVNCTGVSVEGVRFAGPQNSWVVVAPRGSFRVSGSFFTELSSGLSDYDPLNTSVGQHHIAVLLEQPFHSGLPQLSFTFQSTVFEGQYLPQACSDKGNYPVILLTSESHLSGWSTDFTVRNCSFIGCPAFQVFAKQDANLRIVLEDSTFNGKIPIGQAKAWLVNCTANYTGSAVRALLYNSEVAACSSNRSVRVQQRRPLNRSLGSLRISRCLFTQLGSSRGSGVHALFYTPRHSVQLMQVVLAHNHFTNNYGLLYRNLVYVRLLVYSASSTCIDDSSPPAISYPLVLANNNITENFNESKIDYHCAVIHRLQNKFILVSYDFQHKDLPSHYKFSCYRLGAVYLSGFHNGPRVRFEGNTIQENKVAGLMMFRSHVEMVGENVIKRNLGYYGAGMRLNGDSLLLIRNDTNISLEWNRAFFSGGGLYIADDCTLNITIAHCPCFFQFIHDNGSYVQSLPQSFVRPQVFLKGNSAISKGKGSASAIFNSNIKSCVLKANVTGEANNTEVFQKVFNITAKMLNTFRISSIPRRICLFCSDQNKTCDHDNMTVLKYYPGQNLSISVLLEADMNIPMSGVLYVDLVGEKYAMAEKDFFPPELHSMHVLEPKCNHLILPALPTVPQFFFGSQFALQLRVSLFTGTNVFNKGQYLFASVKTQLKPDCPSGFHLRQLTPRFNVCECSSLLERAGIECSLDDGSLNKPSFQYWIGESDGEILWSATCPLIYCNPKESVVPIHSDQKTRKQCMSERVGVICSQCPAGLSVVIGSNECSRCSHWSLLFVLFVLVGGPLLLLAFGTLNMTITAGAINGFIYYVTVVSINQQDFGMPPSFHLCLYSEMDEFGKSVFFFLFPMYLLLLVGIACCLPKCKCVNMHRINRRIGPRITPVLATLITFSYITTTSLVIKIGSYATLHSTDGSSRVVWLYDGSLAYFQSTKHIILGIMALLSFALFLFPAAMVATFGDLLRRCIRGPYYMNFLDTFHGAFRFRFGFWFGVRLLILTMMMLFKFTLTVVQSNLAVVFTLIFIVSFQIVAKPYKGLRLENCLPRSFRIKYISSRFQEDVANIVDNSFLINLLALFTYGASVHRRDGLDVVYLVSVAAASVQFGLVFVYHLLEFTPLGPALIEAAGRTKWRLRRWRESMKRRCLSKNDEKHLEIAKDDDLELRLADCFDGHSAAKCSTDSDSSEGGAGGGFSSSSERQIRSFTTPSVRAGVHRIQSSRLARVPRIAGNAATPPSDDGGGGENLSSPLLMKTLL